MFRCKAINDVLPIYSTEVSHRGDWLRTGSDMLCTVLEHVGWGGGGGGGEEWICGW